VNCGLKRYEHKDSPHDETFQGARSYSEVLSRIQALPPEEMVDFLKFEEHQKSCLPLILQGKTPKIPDLQQEKDKGSNNSSPGEEKNQEGTEEWDTSEQGAEIPDHVEKNLEVVVPSEQVLSQEEMPLQKVGNTPLITSSDPTTYFIPKQSSKEIDSPIFVITPLQFAKGNPDLGWIFNEELNPFL
jgi:hypothetical protein